MIDALFMCLHELMQKQREMACAYTDVKQKTIQNMPISILIVLALAPLLFTTGELYLEASHKYTGQLEIVLLPPMTRSYCTPSNSPECIAANNLGIYVTQNLTL
jgi:hypothetical protein